jgi:predicted DNA-binding transcriptional regulator AlpA
MQGFITTKEAAHVLGVTERTMYYYLRDREKLGFPEPQRFGRALMWEEEPLLKWRAAHPARPKPGDQA